MRWFHRHRVHLLLFGVGLVAFGATAGSRVLRQSTDPHFVYLADAWLHGKLAIDPPPRKGDDWAKVETVELRDGSTVRGRRLVTRPAFRIAGGGEIPISRVERSLGTTYYVSFPPFPAVLMLPQAAIRGRRANDVVTTLLVAALVLPLCFSLLRRLAEAGLSQRSEGEDLWLVAALAFGSVFYFSAVQGRVWFTAHVVGVALALAYAWCSIEARRPVLAGLCLGFATMTRAPMAFMFPLFAFEAWRISGGRAGMRAFLKRGAAFAAPIVAIAIVAMILNYVRFGAPTEFGHTYLAVRQQQQMERYGLFSYQYLSRNLAVALALLPHFSTKAPFVTISGHGLALWVTSPFLLLLLWPRERGPLHLPLWITVAFVAVPSLFYQNTGWVQFGYRFSLDYMPFLIMLLAVGGRPFGKVTKGLICAAIAINLFGAITFARYWRVYRTDRATYSAVIR